MLHLLGCFILVDKSCIYIDARYISLVSELEHVYWAWGVLLCQYYILHLDRRMSLRQGSLLVILVYFRYEYLLGFIYLALIYQRYFVYVIFILVQC